MEPTMAAAISCPNYDVNLEMCPCPNEACDNRGICCACIENHVAKDQKSFCMRDTERPPETRSLSGIAAGKCEQHGINLDRCTCSYTSCDNHATCCDCVRNHWGNTTYPSPACMK
jgi:hypothetical protein